MGSLAPRCSITPVYIADPLEFDIDAGPIPAFLDNLLLPLPPAAQANVCTAVCLPFYTEDGFALARGLQGLALQRADLRRYWSLVKRVPESRLPEIHVFAIADGWRKDDGVRILSESMLTELRGIFGPTLDVDAISSLLEDFTEEEGDALRPTGILVQFAQPSTEPGGKETLAPVELNCSWALSMDARSMPEGGVGSVVSAINASVVRHNRDRERRLRAAAHKPPPAARRPAAPSLLAAGDPFSSPLRIPAAGTPHSNAAAASPGGIMTPSPPGSMKSLLALPSSSATPSRVTASSRPNTPAAAAAAGGLTPALRSIRVSSTLATRYGTPGHASESGAGAAAVPLARYDGFPPPPVMAAEFGGGLDRGSMPVVEVDVLSFPEAAARHSSETVTTEETLPRPSISLSSLGSEEELSLLEEWHNRSAVEEDPKLLGPAARLPMRAEVLPPPREAGPLPPPLNPATVHKVEQVHQPLFFTLLIKRKNARKHHSHRWFFEAMGPVTRLRSPISCRFYFATDCGTLYAPYCLAELIHHMNRNPTVAACTGHQRIMSQADQAEPGDSSGDDPTAARLRRIQAFDFESGLCIFNGVHAMAGFLPVVPGPCGLFRAEATTGDIITVVRDICCSSAAEDGLVTGNLKIAEDRILSYLLVLCTTVDARGQPRDWQTAWVPSTCFFFEAETTLKEFVLQRRRWLNGTTAGYAWLLQQPALWSALERGKRLGFAVLVLSCLQLLVFGVVYLLPGLLAVTGYLVWSGLFVLISMAGVTVPYAADIQLAFLYALLLTFAAHVYLARWGRSNYTPLIWDIRVVLNAIYMAVNLIVTASLLVLSFAAPDAVRAAVGKDNFYDMQLAGCLGTLYATTPFFLAMLHSSESFLMMLRTYPTFFFFLPTIVSDFFAYSLARYDDLSWGTKAVGLAVGQQRERSTVTPASSSIEDGFAARKSAAVRAASANATVSMAVLQVLTCVAITYAFLQLDGLVRHFLLWVGAATCSVGLIIMTLSMAYFVPRALWGKGSGTLTSRALSIVNFVGWLWVVAAYCAMVVLAFSRMDELYLTAALAFALGYAAVVTLAFARFAVPLLPCCLCCRTRV